MKTNSKKNQILMFLSVLLFSLTDSIAVVRNMNAVAQKKHAKELLGKKDYSKSKASQISQHGLAFSYSVEDEVKKSLPKNFKVRSKKITNTLLEQADKYKLDPVFLIAIIKTESAFNPNAIGSVGEIGLMQIRPETAEWITSEYKISYRGKKDLYDPIKNIKIGAAVFDWLRKKSDHEPVSYVAAYNIGLAKVKRMMASNIVPTKYSSKVMKNYLKSYDKLYANIDSKVDSTF